MTELSSLSPLDTAPLLPEIHGALMALLRSLEPADWTRQTVAGAWTVRDVAAHLLDGDLRKLAAHRDSHRAPVTQPVETYADVLALIGRLNADGVAWASRLSPRLITDLLEITGNWTSEFVATLDPNAPALFGVAWAGEAQSDNRLDTAREYTERWHHQMQIRVAVGARGQPELLLAPRYLLPLLETSLRALPHAYRELSGPDGTTIVLQLTGETMRAWTLRRESGGWRLYAGTVQRRDARVAGNADALWRLFFNALPAADARKVLQLDGPDTLISPLLAARSVMV
jgi:hypothetical protein